MSRRWYLLTVAALIVAGSGMAVRPSAAAIGSHATSDTTVARPRPTTIVAPPRPAPQVPAELAVIPVQVTYVLQSLAPVLDSLFPVRDSLAEASCRSVARLVCHQYVYQRDPLGLSATGARFSISTMMRYRALVGVPGTRVASCGYGSETPRRALLSLATDLYWRRDWKIGSRNTALAAQLLDPCRVTSFNLDATAPLQTMIDRQLRDFSAQVDSALPMAADLRPLADSIWKSFLEPSAMDSLNTLWLVLDPEAIRVVPLTGVGPSFRTALVVYARPRVIAGAKPPTINRPLPMLSLGSSPAGFVVPVSVELPFNEVNRRATELLAAETAGTSERVDSVHVQASGDSVRIVLDVSGSLNGKMTLMSRLRWDPVVRELRMDDLQWSLASRGLMSRMKATLAAPLIGRAIRKATMGGRVPVGAQLDSVRIQMLQLLNRTVSPGVTLGGSISSFQVESVSTTDRAFVVRARLVGQANVVIQ
ncbi:MAG: DUF4403 family protein [Gemmatimonadaceae bacterium]|nr:DUF4403 family protein [Gemmatimonadaceae bacterium]